MMLVNKNLLWSIRTAWDQILSVSPGTGWGCGGSIFGPVSHYRKGEYCSHLTYRGIEAARGSLISRGRKGITGSGMAGSRLLHPFTRTYCA